VILNFIDFAQNQPGFGHFYVILTRFWAKTWQNPVFSGFDFPNLANP
jgi:hypothetical protein